MVGTPGIVGYRIFQTKRFSPFFAGSAGYVLSRPAPRLEPHPVVEVDDANDPRAARRLAATPDADGNRDDAAC